LSAGAGLGCSPWPARSACLIPVDPRNLAEGNVEAKRRADGTWELMTPADAVVRLSS